MKRKQTLVIFRASGVDVGRDCVRKVRLGNMEPTRRGRSRRGGRARRTREQIHQQTLPAGNMYSAHENRPPTSAHDVQALLPLPGIVPEEDDIQDPSQGNTTEQPCSGSFRTRDIGHYSVQTSFYPLLDFTESVESGIGRESEPEEFEGDSFVDLVSTVIDLGPVTEERVCLNIGGSDVPSVESPVIIEQIPLIVVDCATRREHLLKWQSLFAILITCGTVRMTVQQYEVIYNLHAWASVKESLPSIRTVQRNLMPAIRDFSYARSSDISLRLKHTKRSNTRLCLEDSSATDTIAFDTVYRDCEKESLVRIVLPSEWARLDCRTATLYDAMFGRKDGIHASQQGRLCYSDIDEIPIVRSRQRFLDTWSQIFVDPPFLHDKEPSMMRLPIQAQDGDFISVGILQPDAFAAVIGQDQPLRIENETIGYLVAQVVGVWGIDECRPGRDDEERRQSPPFLFRSLLKNGDTVAELVPGLFEPCTNGRSIYLLVFRFCRKLGKPSRELLILPRSFPDTEKIEKNSCLAARISSVRMHKQAVADESPDCSPRTGYLKDGRKYVVYRALIYTDDFQPFTSRKGSYGGCYMLPLGLPPDERAGYAAVRCLGLTPPNVSSNEVLLHIIPDIVQCTTNGVQGKTAGGESVTIFLDIVAYIGDYPAVSHVLDVLGHTARAPCHLCSFVRQDRIGDEGLKYYGYSTTIHGRASAFCREARRVRSVRHGESSASVLQLLGLKQSVNETNCPLHVLSSALAKCRPEVPLTDCGVPVVPAVFDPYRSSMVAPDHLLAGLARDVINATVTMCTPEIRRNTESLMRDALRDHNLGRQSELISLPKAVLHTMNLSEVYAVLLVAPYCFMTSLMLKTGGKNDVGSSSEPRSKIPRIGNKQVEQIKVLIVLIEMFQTLVGQTQYRPSAHTDGLQAVSEFNEGNGKSRLDTLFNLACAYISELHKVCTTFPKAVREHLSKPNVHRLLELYAHSLPAFGQIGHFQELLFETAHQPLKRGIKMSNNRDPHLAAVTAVLANDWETRLALCVCCSGDPEGWSEETCLQIEQLVTGDENTNYAEKSRVRSAFSPPVLSQLQSVRRKLLSLPSSGVAWKIEQGSRGRPQSFAGTWRASSALHSTRVRNGLDCFNAWMEENNIYNEQVQIGTWASSWNKYRTGNNSSLKSEKRRESIQPGNVVQSLVNSLALCSRPNCTVKILKTPVDDEGSSLTSVSYWLVLELFETQNYCTETSTTAYALVLPCPNANQTHGKPKFGEEMELFERKLFRVDMESEAYILPLNGSTRVVLCIPACTAGACIGNETNGRVKHSCELSKGCFFYGLGRRDGYPPRVA